MTEYLKTLPTVETTNDLKAAYLRLCGNKLVEVKKNSEGLYVYCMQGAGVESDEEQTYPSIGTEVNFSNLMVHYQMLRNHDLIEIYYKKQGEKP